MNIYISIKPKYTKKIESREKNYEFRKYYPKNKIDKLYVYESGSTKAFKYIIELGEIIKYPDKITKIGYGNDIFNHNLKESKYAYEIKHLYKIKNQIPLETLRKYKFNPPQAYAYTDKYKELTNYIDLLEKQKIF